MGKRLASTALALALGAGSFGIGSLGAGAAAAAPEGLGGPTGSLGTYCPAIPTDLVTRAVKRLAPPFPDRAWVVDGRGSSLDCSLNWVRLDTQGGTVASPAQILWFNRFDYVGTATPKPSSLTVVLGSWAPGQVTVRFRWPRGDDANAAPSGRADVRFQARAGGPPKALDPIPSRVWR